MTVAGIDIAKSGVLDVRTHGDSGKHFIHIDRHKADREVFIVELKVDRNSDDYLTRLKENLETAINEVHPESVAALAAKMAKLQQELIDRTEHRENYDDITEEILRLRELQAQTAMDDNAKSEHKKRIRELLKFIERQKSKVLVFDGSLVKKLLEKVTVYDDYLEFRFKSGVTVSVEK